VLADLLAVPGIARTRLTKVFRQAEQSTIIANAHLIRSGQIPQLKRHDFWFAELDDPERIAELVAEIATERLPRKLGVDPDQVQVLCPARRGAAGADQLSRMLQERLNPRAENEPEYWHGPRVFRVGDRVIATSNDYARGAHGVYNGTLGTVVDLDLKEAGLTVETEDGESVRYDLDDLDDLAHSYALTVHKAQGSEFPHVVAPAHDGRAEAADPPSVLHAGHPRAADGGAGRPAARAADGAGDRGPGPRHAAGPPPRRGPRGTGGEGGGVEVRRQSAENNRPNGEAAPAGARPRQPQGDGRRPPSHDVVRDRSPRAVCRRSLVIALFHLSAFASASVVVLAENRLTACARVRHNGGMDTRSDLPAGAEAVTGPLVVAATCPFPGASLSWRFSRSSGPGGQGVNTTDSRIELSLDLRTVRG
jgi:hypothetical protein